MSMLINFAAFQFGWFASVLSAAAMVPWLGVIAVCAIIALHLYRAQDAAQEFVLILICGAIGSLWDSVLVAMGWVSYPSGMLIPQASPYWIVSMWLLFATTLNVSMGWLKGRPWLAAVFGLVGGPLAYIAGQKLGGIYLLDSTAALSALGLGWAVLMPLLLVIAERFNGISEMAPDAAATASRS